MPAVFSAEDIFGAEAVIVCGESATSGGAKSEYRGGARPGYQTHTTAYTHDAFGRVATSTQTTGTTPYTFTYGYSLTDALTSMQYPSGRQVTYGLDAADRVTTVQNVTGGGNYAAVTYNAPGAISAIAMGSGATQAFSWNDRVQPTQLSVTGAPSAGSPSLLTLGFFPCASAATSCSSGNNGNLQSQTIALPGLSLTQNYSYDHLNRLTGAVETGGSGWTQNYGFDIAGNRWVGTSPGPITLTNATPQAAGWFGSTCSGSVCSGSPNNRVLSSEGWSYDPSGNVLQAGSSALTYTYDAENRQVTAQVNGATSNYSYDGNGLRVSKTVGAQTTTYVYDTWGNAAAEYSTVIEASACGTPTCYVTEDHLGSTRMLTDSAGSTNVRRYDYLPFGQELLAGMGSRTVAEGYLSAADDTDPKFTGQDRDQETGNDWFQVRQMSGAAGRFHSVDPGNAGADVGDPQSWNGYSYVGNNPMSFTDPSGMCWWCDVIGIGLDVAGILTGGSSTIIGSILMAGGTVAVGGDTAGRIIDGLAGAAGGGVFNTGPSSGPAITNFNSIYHGLMTLSAGGSLGLAFGDIWVDFMGTQGTGAPQANMHAMGGRSVTFNGSWRLPLSYGKAQTACEAYAGTVAAVRADTVRAQAGDPTGTRDAVHAIQDSYSASHMYQNWSGSLTMAHEKGDWALDASYSKATAATKRYLQGLSGSAPMAGPESYLSPRPAGCK